jgi:ribonuclease Z
MAQTSSTSNEGMSVILLGTGTPLPNPDRACASTLIICGDKSFLVDTGRGFLRNFAAAGLTDVSAVLFTHYHSDHFSEFGEFMVNRTIMGAERPMLVIGPYGAKQVIDALLQAYSLDNGYRKSHHGSKWNEKSMWADIQEMKAGIVYDKDAVKITMFEVNHQPVAPAMGYRFEHNGHTVVVSGDTVKVPVMAEMSKGADILVHDATNKGMVEMGISFLKSKPGPENDRRAEMAAEMLAYHAHTNEVAAIAAEAGIKKLVLTHLVPSIPQNSDAEARFSSGLESIFKGRIYVGKDGMRVNSWD